MKVRELINMLSKADLDKDILFSSDEELNCLRSRGEICEIEDIPNTLVVYGFDGSEVEFDDDFEIVCEHETKRGLCPICNNINIFQD